MIQAWVRERVGGSSRAFWLVSILLLLMLPTTTAEGLASDGRPEMEVAENILRNRHCPCGCGSYLPGSRNEPACFGCSVGKAEISRVLEALATGRSQGDIVMELNETVLVNVFSDYTNPDLPEIWQRAVRVAGEFRQHRVVLRTPGRTEDARRAIKLAECARAAQKFSQVQQALMRHPGPWDEETLIELAKHEGLNPKEVQKCLGQTDISAQIAKDKQHAKRFGVQRLPAISVNQQLIPTTVEAVRRAIRKVIEDETI